MSVAKRLIEEQLEKDFSQPPDDKRECKRCGEAIPSCEYGPDNDPELTSFPLCAYCSHMSSKD